ncbi:MAG: hypothetical protein ACKO3M_11465 [Rubrivivax sp.]
MSNDALDKLIWVLIYCGLLVLCLGLFVLRTDAGLGWGLVVVGGAVAAVGAALVVVRARRGPGP